MLTADEIIKQNQLEKHPEGGYFKRIYQHSESADFGEKYAGKIRNLCSSIYYLLKKDEVSTLHIIKNSVESWYYHSGCPMLITVINPITGVFEQAIIGNPAEGYEPYFAIPQNYWLAAQPLDGKDFSFCSCTVVPGFDFRDWKLMTMEELKVLIPNPPENILSLLRD